MPRKPTSTGLAEYLNDRCGFDDPEGIFSGLGGDDLDDDGHYYHGFLTQGTASYVGKYLNPPGKDGKLWDRLDDALGDPLLVDRLDAEGPEIVRMAFEMTLRRHRVLRSVEEAEKELSRNQQRVHWLTETNKRHANRKDQRYFDRIVKIVDGSERVGTLETIIGEMKTVARVLDLCIWGYDIGEFDEALPRFMGRIPEGLLDLMFKDGGLEGLRRRVEFADEVCARLHSYFPRMMAELRADLLRAEGPEGQPGHPNHGRRTGKQKGRGITLNRNRTV